MEGVTETIRQWFWRRRDHGYRDGHPRCSRCGGFELGEPRHPRGMHALLIGLRADPAAARAVRDPAPEKPRHTKECINPSHPLDRTCAEEEASIRDFMRRYNISTLFAGEGFGRDILTRTIRLSDD